MEKVFYFDDNNMSVDEEHATRFTVIEYDEDGNVISHENFIIRKPGEEGIKRRPLTPEEEKMFYNVKNSKGEYPFRK